MKKIILFTILLLASAGPLSAQQKSYIAGADYSKVLPIGTLKDRWEAAPAYAVYFGISTSDKWIWTGRIEYFKFEDLNKDKLKIPYTATVGSTNYNFILPILKLKQDLSAGGLVLNAKYNLIRSAYADVYADLGFGMYNWTYNRTGYDSVYIDTTISGAKKHFVALKNVPSNSQTDWSAGFLAGVEICLKPYSVFEITLGADYKNIIGELWPALSFNYENVSTFQMFSFRAGLKAVL